MQAAEHVTPSPQSAITNNNKSDWQILQERDFDNSVFTQGLFIHQHQLYYSSGGYGRSFIAKIDLATTKNPSPTPTIKRLSPQLFSEGFTEHQGKLFLLTWKSEALLSFSYDFKMVSVHTLRGEGWGLTSDGEYLIKSDGSNKLSFIKSQDMSISKQIAVNFNGQAVDQLNELEWAEGYIWANAWHDDHIYQIDPTTGTALRRWDLSTLRLSLQLENREAVLNGIAWDEQQQAFWLTGKLWPKRFLVKLHQNQAQSLPANVGTH